MQPYLWVYSPQLRYTGLEVGLVTPGGCQIGYVKGSNHCRCFLVWSTRRRLGGAASTLTLHSQSSTYSTRVVESMDQTGCHEF
jgi:hypothetical protein